MDSLAFGPGGTTLAVGDINGRVYLWDVASRTNIATLTDPKSDGVDSVAFGPGGTTLAAGDLSGSTYLWNLAAHAITATFTDPGGGEVQSVAFGPGGTSLASGDTDGSVHSRVGVNWRYMAGSGGSQGFPSMTARMASRTLIPWPAAEAR